MSNDKFEHFSSSLLLHYPLADNYLKAFNGVVVTFQRMLFLNGIEMVRLNEKYTINQRVQRVW